MYNSLLCVFIFAVSAMHCLKFKMSSLFSFRSLLRHVLHHKFVHLIVIFLIVVDALVVLFVFLLEVEALGAYKSMADAYVPCVCMLEWHGMHNM